jgi:pyridoxine kinase
MPRCLILSSFVAASRVGGSAQALALARLGIDPILVPTVLYGRHPGLGSPGGGPVEAATFEAMLGGVEAAGGFMGLDAVITGHFSSAQQVATAAEALGRIRAASPGARIVVDPIMGDADVGLYVRAPVADAIAAELLPAADVVAPNAWELARISGLPVDAPGSAAAAADALGLRIFVSSVPVGDDVGVVYAMEDGVWCARHARFGAAPRGTGDLLTAAFVACLVEKLDPEQATLVATGVVADAVVRDSDAGDLSLKSFPTELRASRWVTVEPVGV